MQDVRNATFAPNKEHVENCMEINYRNLYRRVVCHLFMILFPVLGFFKAAKEVQTFSL